MKTTGKYEDLKKAAAEARHRMHKVEEDDYHGLASIRPVKMISPDEETERKRNKEIMEIIKWITEVNKTRQNHNNDWNIPADWRKVIEKTVTVLKYIPFEQKDIQLSEAVRYVTEGLSKHERPKNVRAVIGEDTPLWYLSRNILRRALYRASIKRARMVTN